MFEQSYDEICWIKYDDPGGGQGDWGDQGDRIRGKMNLGISQG